jgi:hypothetical protein
MGLFLAALSVGFDMGSPLVSLGGVFVQSTMRSSDLLLLQQAAQLAGALHSSMLCSFVGWSLPHHGQ